MGDRKIAYGIFKYVENGGYEFYRWVYEDEMRRHEGFEEAAGFIEHEGDYLVQSFMRGKSGFPIQIFGYSAARRAPVTVSKKYGPS